MAALKEFGAPLHEVTQEDFEKQGLVFQVGVAPRRIDILTSIDAVEFPEAWESREEVRVAGLTVPVIGREELIKNKLATGRLEDRADAMSLQDD